MKYYLLIAISLFWSITVFAQTNTMAAGQYVLVIHGGAGTIVKGKIAPEKEKLYEQALQQALQAGSAILANNGSALDAVQAAVMVLEDNLLFNAGKGAVLTNEGTIELDAAIMDGGSLKAGAVSGITTIKNPVTAARAVMDKSEHVMMIGKGAEQFAAMNGCTVVEPSYFYTENQQLQWKRSHENDSSKIMYKLNEADSLQQLLHKFGTVGAVALDKQGNLAAATSTGGMMNKKYGRVGDAPIIGAGTYANNATCAISCTGWGEYFIRLVLSKTVSDQIEWTHKTLQAAADEMIYKQLNQLGGSGGLIAVDKNGNIAMPFNTPGMMRGYIKSTGETHIELYGK